MIAKIAHPSKADKTTVDNNLFPVSCGYYRINEEDLGNIRKNGRKDYYLYYVVHGKSRGIMGGRPYVANEGDIVFYNYLDRQEYVHLAAYDTQIYWLHFNGSKAADILNDLGITESTILHTKLNLAEYFENIIRELTYQNSQYYKAAVGNIFLILANISRKSESRDEKMDYVISLMNNVENSSLTLDDYARICHLSKSQFIRAFKKYTMQTPINYKNKLTIKNAEWYLENTDYSISEIASILQFENIYYFSSMFKKHTGLSPSKYKEKFYGQ